jgi:CRP/FNR family transcriptional regulator, dissimilatory nitrate respiration regulator
VRHDGAVEEAVEAMKAAAQSERGEIHAARPQPEAHHARVAHALVPRLPLFRGLIHDKLQALLAQSRRLEVARGAIIMKQGERTPGLFAILAGSVKTRLLHPHGDDRVLSLLGPGDTFGEAAALLQRAASVDAVAITEASLAVIDCDAMMALFDHDRRFWRNLTALLARRTDELYSQLGADLLPSLRRLASYLDSLAMPAALPGQWTARLPVSKTLVAAQIGVKKETLSRLLKQLAMRGVISVARREITILDRDGLARLSLPSAPR